MKPSIVTVMLLAVSVLAFAGLAYRTVPMSATQTITPSSTETLTSYAGYMVTNTATYTSTSLQGISISTCCKVVCIGPPVSACFLVSITFSLSSTITQLPQSTYLVQRTSTIPYSQTRTSSLTQTSTNVVPASQALGLTDQSFSALAIGVIGGLILVTVWIAFKSQRRRVNSLSLDT